MPADQELCAGGDEMGEMAAQGWGGSDGSPPRELRVDVIRDISALTQLRSKWQKLVGVSHEGSAFTSPAASLSWYRLEERRNGIYAVSVWRGHELVGMAPFSITTLGGFRLLTSAGAEHSYHGDPLLASDPHAVAYSIIDHLCQVTKKGTAAVNLRRLRTDGSILEALRERSDVAVRLGRTSSHSVVRFGEIADLDSYFARIARKHSVERRRRRLIEGFEHVAYVPDDPEPDQAIAMMVDMLQRRFGSSGGAELPGFLKQLRTPFTQSMFRQLVDAGNAHVSSLVVGARRAAVSINLQANSRLFAHSVAQEPELARYGLGNIELYEFLQHAYRSGVAEVDLGASKFEYKKTWANYDVQVASAVVTAPGVRGDVAQVVRRAAMSYRARRMNRRSRAYVGDGVPAGDE